MPPYRRAEDILREYSGRIEKQIATSSAGSISYSREYLKFKSERANEISRYERWCKSLGNIIKLKISEKDKLKIKKFLDIAHLDLEPWQPLTLSVMVFLSILFLGLLISVSVALIKGGIFYETFPYLFFFLVIILAFFLFYFVNGYPL
jgi:hypothetical protein